MAFKGILLGIFFYFLNYYLISAQDKDCAGHDVTVDHFRNCPGNKGHHIKIHNVTMKVTDDCRLVPRGCFIVKKTIKNATVYYSISKPPLKKKGNEDFCKMLESQNHTHSYKSLPKRCVISPGDYCISKGSTKLEQLSARTLNLLSGVTTGTFNVENADSSDKACVEFQITITKKKG